MKLPLQDYDFSALDSPDFKEDAVREDIVAPLLRALGFAESGRKTMTRSQPLTHPFFSIGSQSRKTSIFPDYILKVDDKVVMVLDAKSPTEAVDDRDHISQVFSYAIHPDVRAHLFALCNGRELALYRVAEPGSVPYFRADLTRLATSWSRLKQGFSDEALLGARMDSVSRSNDGPIEWTFPDNLDEGLILQASELVRTPSDPLGDIASLGRFVQSSASYAERTEVHSRQILVADACWEAEIALRGHRLSERFAQEANRIAAHPALISPVVIEFLKRYKSKFEDGNGYPLHLIKANLSLARLTFDDKIALACSSNEFGKHLMLEWAYEERKQAMAAATALWRKQQTIVSEVMAEIVSSGRARVFYEALMKPILPVVEEHNRLAIKFNYDVDNNLELSDELCDQLEKVWERFVKAYNQALALLPNRPPTFQLQGSNGVPYLISQLEEHLQSLQSSKDS